MKSLIKKFGLRVRFGFRLGLVYETKLWSLIWGSDHSRIIHGSFRIIQDHSWIIQDRSWIIQDHSWIIHGSFMDHSQDHSRDYSGSFIDHSWIIQDRSWIIHGSFMDHSAVTRLLLKTNTFYPTRHPQFQQLTYAKLTRFVQPPEVSKTI